MRLILSAVTAAALAFAPTLEAQKTPKKEAEKKAEPVEKDGCVTRDGRTECIFRKTSMDSVLRNRPVVGIELSPTGTKRDTIGVFVSRVTPDGPAEKAGIVEGDRIVSINGVDLRVNAADAEDGYAADLPRRRLTREVGKLAPGNVANMRVWSGGRVRDVAVTVGRASELKDRRMFGEFGEGFPEGYARLMPTMMDGMRMQLRSMPKIRMEQMPRMRFNYDNFPRMEFPDDGVFFERLKKSKVEEEKAKEKEKSKK